MGTTRSQDQIRQAAADIQANLVRPAKFAGGKTKTWSLFFFFRIMAQAEMDATACRLNALVKKPADSEALQTLWRDLERPNLANVGLVRQALEQGDAGADQPAERFRSWLHIAIDADKTAALADLRQLAKALDLSLDVESRAEPGVGTMINILQMLEALQSLTQINLTGLSSAMIKRVFTLYAQALTSANVFKTLLSNFGATPGPAGLAALSHGLLGVAFYELLRQGAPAFERDQPGPGGWGVIRGEAKSFSAAAPHGLYDPFPCNAAFSFSGLQALKLDEKTLASFPDPFRQGMAARASRLNDTGPSAPSGWEGEYGLPSVHGFFTGGFLVGGGEERIPEAYWRRLREDIDAFNDPSSDRGRVLRVFIGALFRQIGVEIVHVELGQDPYRVDDAGYAVPLPDRVEHFGFRDGLSQPFVDMGLGDPLPGGATPDRDGTWSPVAPGELYLDLPDEDGECQLQPINQTLRSHATYLVFRKLEQDVRGFRTFVEHQRPGDRGAQHKLASQFVGRWPNGTPLVLSPDAERDVSGGYEAALNDFRYAQDDPFGRKCPLGAHIRRANPRDTGGRDEVKRHRILRRSISYGGPLLNPNSLGDGRARGLLFMAVNSRIDLQFEVIQADWINGGEFLGQAGLDRCPLIGSHNGGREDSFLEAGAVAPVTGLPRFVTMRGGEYFFAPGVEALKLMANGCSFPAEPSPFGDFAMADDVTPSLLDPDRLKTYITQILQGSPSAVRLQTPAQPDGRTETIVFVGQHKDVERVLADRVTSDGALEFSVRRYHQVGQRITRGQDFIIGTDDAGPTAGARKRLYGYLCRAWRTLYDEVDIPAVLADSANRRLDLALRRTAQAGRIDLVHDLAVQAAYGVLTDLYGTPGPAWLTELAAALPLGSQHVASLPPDWLAALKGSQPTDPGLTTVQTWSVLILADMLGNLLSQHEVWPISRQAGAEMLSHIDLILAAARANRPDRPRTLVDAFVANEPSPHGEERYACQEAYYRDVAVILLELMGDTIGAIPAMFGHVLGFLLDHSIDLASLRPVLDAPAPSGGGLCGADQLIFEAERLDPVLPILLRHCDTTTKLPSGAKVKKGEWVAALVQAADIDPRAFSQPYEFSLDPFIPGTPRKAESYLAFGATGTDRACWGRDRVAMAVLRECVKAAALLRGLRGVAGPGGGRRVLVGITVGLPARFTRVDSPNGPPPGSARGRDDGRSAPVRRGLRQSERRREPAR